MGLRESFLVSSLRRGFLSGEMELLSTQLSGKLKMASLGSGSIPSRDLESDVSTAVRNSLGFWEEYSSTVPDWIKLGLVPTISQQAVLTVSGPISTAKYFLVSVLFFFKFVRRLFISIWQDG